MNLPNSALKAPRTGEGSAAHSAQDVASSPVKNMARGRLRTCDW
jgi:hypothetical protein